MGSSDLCRFSVHAMGIRIIFPRQKTAQKIIAVCIRLRYELLSGAPKSTFSALIIPSRTPGGPSEAPLKTLGAPWARGAPWVLWAPGALWALRGLSNLLPRDIAQTARRPPFCLTHHPLRGSSLGALWKNLTTRGFLLELAAGRYRADRSPAAFFFLPTTHCAAALSAHYGNTKPNAPPPSNLLPVDIAQTARRPPFFSYPPPAALHGGV